MKIGVMKFDLQIPHAQSLKDKRQVIRSLKDRIYSRFKVSIAEVGDQDLHQRATLGICFIAIETPTADAKMQKLEDFVESHGGAVVIELEKEILHED